jgi:hypothetical protein
MSAVKKQGPPARTSPVWVYVVTDDRGCCKVGIAQDLAARLGGLQCGNPYPLRVHSAWQLRNEAQAGYIEKMVRMNCWRHWMRGEWLKGSPEAVARLVVKKIWAFGSAPHRKHGDSFYWKEPQHRAAIVARGGLRVLGQVRP